MTANLLSFDFFRGRLSAEQLEELAVSLGFCLDCCGSLVAYALKKFNILLITQLENTKTKKTTIQAFR